MSSDLQILRDLTEIVKTAGSFGGGKGRFARTPDFSAPSHPSSRPSTDRGTTFHFAHKTVSKKNDISDGSFSQTTSAAHQGYIERPSAAEKTEPDIYKDLLEIPATDDDGAKSDHVFNYPERVVDRRNISFGTLGNTKAERKQFWNEVEGSEQRNARVQSRIIAELPVELDSRDRSKIARDFCQQSFEDRGLPYWATLHAPTKKNDPRNYHLHVTYWDRPAARSNDGTWDFQVTEKKRRANRSIATTRPYRKPKHVDTRDIAWPKKLRSAFADTCNYYLAMAGLAKRNDPRSYKDSGLAKEPTEHLGNKSSALESFGLETERGKRNARKEIRWRVAQAETPWMDRVEMLQTSQDLNHTSMSDKKEALLGIASKGITLARRSISHLITAELLGHRVTRRDSFLNDEVMRILKKDDVSTIGDDAQTRLALESEALLIADRKQRIQELVSKCTMNGMALGASSKKLEETFDMKMKEATASDLFVDDTSSGFEAIEDLIEAPAAVSKSDGPSKPDTLDDPFLEDQDLNDISDFLGELTADAKPKPTTSTTAKDDRDGIIEDDDREGVSSEYDPTAMPRKKRKSDPIEAIIARLANGEAEDNKVPVRTVKDFPGTLPIQKPSGPEDVRKIDQDLRVLDNRSLRQTAIANRDATDICPPGQLRENFNRGWIVLRFEAN
ncbi:MobA/MobL family protein, partial [Loktanella sp. DJP18]|uniref:MobA/MobL family protein n=1 Tax=Loktanella sp. DJP18 TaxID=3409788 RepID=UPI003BB54B6C